MSVNLKADFHSLSISLKSGFNYNSLLFYLTEAPVVLTFPHFLDTSEVYSSLVEGLNPDPELHQNVVIMEPVSCHIN